MSDDPDSNSGLRPPQDPYEIGYGRPPKETRFQPGQSGNPRGRPKGARRRPREKEYRLIDELILKEARRTIQIKEGDKTRKMSIVEAAMRSLSVAALKGNHRAQRLMLEHVRRAEAEEQLNKLENFKKLYESVRRVHAGLHSFLSMRRIEARRKNASPFRFRHSQSFASLRHRPSHAKVRSTTQRFGRTTNVLAASDRLTISTLTCAMIFPTAARNSGP